MRARPVIAAFCGTILLLSSPMSAKDLFRENRLKLDQQAIRDAVHRGEAMPNNAWSIKGICLRYPTAGR